MTVCPNTGLNVPECSCSVCVRNQLEQHVPSLLASTEQRRTAARPPSRMRSALARRFRRAA